MPFFFPKCHVSDLLCDTIENILDGIGKGNLYNCHNLKHTGRVVDIVMATLPQMKEAHYYKNEWDAFSSVTKRGIILQMIPMETPQHRGPTSVGLFLAPSWLQLQTIRHYVVP